MSTVTTTTAPPPAGQGVTAIGDSIMVDAAARTSNRCSRASPSTPRWANSSYQVHAVPQLKQQGIVGNRLILELGTNGPYSVQQMEQLINSLGPMRKIVLVNTRVPRPWQQQVNQTIAQVAQAYPQATVVDWYADSATHPGYFYCDGVHHRSPGAKYYASLLAQAVKTPAPSTVPETNHRGR